MGWNSSFVRFTGHIYSPMIMGIESSGVAITTDWIKTKILQDVRGNEGTSGEIAFFGKKHSGGGGNGGGGNGGGSNGGGSDGGFSNGGGRGGRNNGGGHSGRGKSNVRCYRCNKLGHISRDCSHKKFENKCNAAESLLCTSLAVMGHNNDDWYIDSGATAHMTPQRNLLKNSKSPATSPFCC